MVDSSPRMVSKGHLAQLTAPISIVRENQHREANCSVLDAAYQSEERPFETDSKYRGSCYEKVAAESNNRPQDRGDESDAGQTATRGISE